MNKKVFILNGAATAGKNTFANFVDEIVPVCHYSYVDFARYMLEDIGVDINAKTDKLRTLICNVNNDLEDYDDIPFKDCEDIYKDFINGNIEADILFIDCREPKKIERMKKAFNAKTVFVKSNKINIATNIADKAVDEKYTYDFYINNEGTISELRDEAIDFVKKAGVD